MNLEKLHFHLCVDQNSHLDTLASLTCNKVYKEVRLVFKASFDRNQD